MISFQWLWAFLLLPLPLLVRWLAPPRHASRAGALKVPFFGEMTAAGLVTRAAKRPPLGRLLMLSLIWLLLVAAAARPAYVGRPVPLPQEGRDLMLAVDLSGSMARKDFTQDGRPTDRLTVVKAVADAFIANRRGDRIGLILFSSRAYVQAPLTFDRTVVRNLLGSSVIGLTGQETAIGDAIGLAVKTLRTRPADQRMLVLLTDGANNSGILEPLSAAEAAKQENVRIYTIGVGADQMAGQRVVNAAAELDEGTLAQIAEMTGGRYFRARDTAGLARIYADINAMEPSTGEPRYVSPTVTLFQWPLGAALLLSLVLAAGLILPALRLRRSPAVKEARP